MSFISQKPVNFKFQSSERVQTTSFAGAALIREFLKKSGLRARMQRFFLKKAGYTDEVILEALILLLASGGTCLSDWEYLKAESGFETMFGKACPSVDTLERYLRLLETSVPERKSDLGQVGYTTLLEDLQAILIQQAWKRAGSPKKLNLDVDAMLIPTDKSSALYSYEKEKAYQPLNAYCPQLGLILAHEFRDGNVSPMEGYQRLIERCQKRLPGVVQWIIRSDSAGYQNELLDWMQDQRMAYVVPLRDSSSLRESVERAKDWKKLILDGIDTGEEFALMDYCPSFSNQEELKKRSRTRRTIALRRRGENEEGQQELFYVYQVVVTNDLYSSPEKVIGLHRKRCGSVEFFHSQIKGDLSMRRLPSQSFKVNVAWYALGCLTHNLLRAIQQHLLPESWKKYEIKTLRFRFFKTVACVIQKARRVMIRIPKSSPASSVLLEAWAKLERLSLSV